MAACAKQKSLNKFALKTAIGNKTGRITRGITGRITRHITRGYDIISQKSEK